VAVTGSDLVLTVDLGTGGPKVGFVSIRGEVLWWEHTPVPTIVGEGGARTQDAEHWWSVITESVRRGVVAVGGERVAAVSVTGQWASTVPVDEAGRPVDECVLWSDTRGAPYSRRLVGGPVSGYAPKPLATWLRRSGGIPTTSGADTVGHLLFWQHERPDVLDRARWLLEPVDYLTMRFTGVPAATLASMTGAWLTDNRDLAALRYDDVLVRAAGVDAAQLPPLVPTGSVVGPVLPDVAELLGIPASAVAVTGLPDLHSAAVGAGAIELGQPHASIGTTAWISAPVPRKKTDVLRQQASVPGLDNASYLLANNQESAGRNLQWWRDTVAPEESYDVLLAEAATSLPGARDATFTPWLTGERSPVDDRNARAGFHGIGETTTRGDLTRAVLEGVALNAGWLLGAAERFVGGRLDDIRLVGGGARSDLWCQILADATDRTIVRVSDPWLAGLRGAGLFAALATGRLHREEVRELVLTDPPFRPRAQHRATYDALAAELPKLYAAQRGFFKRSARQATRHGAR
jgi:xylulokinase